MILSTNNSILEEKIKTIVFLPHKFLPVTNWWLPLPNPGWCSWNFLDGSCQEGNKNENSVIEQCVQSIIHVSHISVFFLFSWLYLKPLNIKSRTSDFKIFRIAKPIATNVIAYNCMIKISCWLINPFITITFN